MFAQLKSTWRSLRQRARFEGELDEEMRSHIEARADDLARSGVSTSREDALRRARLEFGCAEAHQDAVRESRRISWFQDFAQDLRFGARMLRKSPGFTIVAVLTLALGIGATTAFFSVVKAVLLKPLPYHEPNRLAVLWTNNARKDLHQERTSYPNFEDWRKQNTTFDDMAFASAFTVNITGAEETERLLAARTSANLFSLMGVQPIWGRAFSSAEENQGERVILVSQGLWQRSFGPSPYSVGKSLEVDGVRMTIIGVMPATFEFPAKNVDLWEPLTVFSTWSALKAQRNAPSGFVVGRLAPYVSFSRAQADMDVIAAHLASQYPDLAANLDFFGFQVNVMPLSIYSTGREVRTALWLLFGAALFVLFIACTNVASLLLSRSAARSTEFAIRTALGAGRKRIARQLLTEIAVLYLISGTLGIAFAAAGDNLLLRLAPTNIPRLSAAGIDFGVLSFALGLSFLAAFVFGFFPALKVSATDPHSALKQSGRNMSDTSTSVRLRSLLVTAEFAVTVILLIGAGLLIRSFSYARHVEPGFRPDHVLTVRVVQSKFKSEIQWRDFYEQALDNITAILGVEAAGAIDNFFFESFPDETVIVEGHAPLSFGSSLSQVTDDGISPGYFQALAVPLLRGRFFTNEDGSSSPRTAIINATMSRRYWPGEDPVGKRFRFAYQTERDSWSTVVGVVGDMHRNGLTRDPVSEVFLPLTQHPARGMDLVVRTSADPRGFAAPVRNAIQSADKTTPVFNVSTLEDVLRDQMAPRRFQTLLLTLFSSFAVLLSAIGVYGLVHYSVTQRTRELGIRVALGAQRVHVLLLVAGEGGRTVLLGIAIGVGGAAAAGRVLRSQLFGVTATDPMTFLAVVFLLCLVAFAASYVPTSRAMRVDPMVALRHE